MVIFDDFNPYPLSSLLSPFSSLHCSLTQFVEKQCRRSVQQQCHFHTPIIPRGEKRERREIKEKGRKTHIKEFLNDYIAELYTISEMITPKQQYTLEFFHIFSALSIFLSPNYSLSHLSFPLLHQYMTNLPLHWRNNSH